MASVQELRKLYRDANKDGKPGLTLEELRAFIKIVDPKMANKVVAEIFDLIDADDDKLISEDEFVNALKE